MKNIFSINWCRIKLKFFKVISSERLDLSNDLTQKRLWLWTWLEKDWWLETRLGLDWGRAGTWLDLRWKWLLGNHDLTRLDSSTSIFWGWLDLTWLMHNLQMTWLDLGKKNLTRPSLGFTTIDLSYKNSRSKINLLFSMQFQNIKGYKHITI